jgi:hypothetical protein
MFEYSYYCGNGLPLVILVLGKMLKTKSLFTPFGRKMVFLLSTKLMQAWLG